MIGYGATSELIGEFARTRAIKVSSVNLLPYMNSSSVHSILYAPGHKIKERWEPPVFGWGPGVITTRDTKLKYLSAVLGSNLKFYYNLTDDLARATLQGLGLPVPDDTTYYKLYHIDHQSEPRLPVTSFMRERMKDINWQYWNDFKEWLLQPEIVIVLDNDERVEYDYELGYEVDSKDVISAEDIATVDSTLIRFLSVPLASVGPCIARKDENGFWTVIIRQDGAYTTRFFKLRFSFDRNADIRYSHGPESIDLKITNFCMRNCEYCYQNSGPSGQHGDLGYITGIVSALQGQCGLLEVALGGGEPTEHPEFQSILEHIVWCDALPSFTTHSVRWLYDDNLEEIMKYTTGIAFSVDDTKDFRKTVHAMERVGFWGLVKRYGVQVTFSITEFNFDYGLVETISDYATGNDNVPMLTVLLLGTKYTGRFETYAKEHHSRTKREHTVFHMSELVRSRTKRGLRVAIAADSVFYEQYGHMFETALPIMKPDAEGQYSWYIDAVEKKHAYCSFAGARAYHDVSDLRTKEVAADVISKQIEFNERRFNKE